MFEGDLSADIWSVEQERNHWFSCGVLSILMEFLIISVVIMKSKFNQKIFKILFLFCVNLGTQPTSSL